MNSLNKLCGSVSLIDSVELSLPTLGYVDVSKYDKIRLAIYTSTIVKVQLEWSHDNQRTGPINMYRCGSAMWKCDVFETILPYLRIHVINESGRPCDDLIVYTWAVDIKQEVVDVVSPLMEPPPKTLVSRFLPQRKNIPPPALHQKPTHDDRLPDFIPQGSILVGGDKGRIVAIPKGNVGEYFMMGDLGPTYKLPYPPTQLSQESKEKLDAQIWS